MAKRKWFTTEEIFFYLRNIPDDVSECEDNGSEYDNLYNPEQDLDSSFSNKSDPDLSKSFTFLPDLSNRFSERPRTQNKLETTKVEEINDTQEINDTAAALSASNNQRGNEQRSDVTPGTVIRIICPRNTFAEPAREDSQYIVSKI